MCPDKMLAALCCAVLCRAGELRLTSRSDVEAAVEKRKSAGRHGRLVTADIAQGQEKVGDLLKQPSCHLNTSFHLTRLYLLPRWSCVFWCASVRVAAVQSALAGIQHVC